MIDKKSLKKTSLKSISSLFFFLLCILLCSAIMTQEVCAQTEQKAKKENKSTNTLVKNEPINIDADNQKIDLNKDTLLFTGNVISIQGTLVVKSETLLVENMSRSEDQVITAKGNPVYFEQQIDGKNGPELVKGNGKQLVYNVEKDLLTLTGNAVVYKTDGTVKGNIITYNLETDVIQAFSGDGERVNTVLQPTKK